MQIQSATKSEAVIRIVEFDEVEANSLSGDIDCQVEPCYASETAIISGVNSRMSRRQLSDLSDLFRDLSCKRLFIFGDLLDSASASGLPPQHRHILALLRNKFAQTPDLKVVWLRSGKDALKAQSLAGLPVTVTREYILQWHEQRLLFMRQQADASTDNGRRIRNDEHGRKDARHTLAVVLGQQTGIGAWLRQRSHSYINHARLRRRHAANYARRKGATTVISDVELDDNATFEAGVSFVNVAAADSPHLLYLTRNHDIKVHAPAG